MRLLALFLVALVGAGCPRCDKTLLDKATAPSGLVATAYWGACGSVAGYDVYLSKADDDTDRTKVFMAFFPSDADSDWPYRDKAVSVTWHGANQVVVTYAAWLKPVVAQRSFQGLEIIYEQVDVPLPPRLAPEAGRG